MAAAARAVTPKSWKISAPGSSLLCPVHHLAPHDRQHDAHILDPRWWDAEEVVREYDQVGEFARGDGTLFLFLKRRVRAALGVGAQGFLDRQPLLRKPTVGMLAVESGARHRRVDAQQRIERGHGPVGAEG